MSLHYDRLVVDLEPCKLIFSSEPYVATLKIGFSPAADVILTKNGSKSDKTLLLSAQSLSVQLLARMKENGDKLTGVEVWVYKSGAEKTAKYVVED